MPVEDSGDEESSAPAANEATANSHNTHDSPERPYEDDRDEGKMPAVQNRNPMGNAGNGEQMRTYRRINNNKPKRRSPRSLKERSSKDCDETMSEIVDNSPNTKNQDDETSSSGDHSEERTEDAKRIPIREILTPPRRPPTRRKKELDANTLDLFKVTLNENKGDALEEDELIHFATRLYRNADRHVSYRSSISRRLRSTNDSGNESDDSTLFAECLAAEEEYAIGNDHFKKIVSSIHKKNAGTASKSQSTAFKMDRRTLNWIKGASGIQRTDKHYLAKSKVSTRRRACKQSPVSRSKKQAKGLDLMCEAIDDVEIDHGPFPKAIRRPVPPKRRYDADDELPTKSMKKMRTETSHRSEASGVKKRSQETIDHRPTKRRQLPRQLPKTRSQVDTAEPPLLDVDICTDLKELDQVWKAVSPDTVDETPPLETEASYSERSDKMLHPKLFKADVRHRLPSMETLKRTPNEIPEKVAPGVYGPQRTRHTESQYAGMCSKLMNMLLKMRMFVTAEFFYSDLDREWYNHDVVGAQLRKLGLKPDEVITARQWKAMRRLVRSKPRRFSSNFIASQLNERNMYRCTVRRLQDNPQLAVPAGFPFDVYEPIPVGTIVTAYCKYFRMMQRGKVIAYEKSSAVYFIEFESKQFGYELCPDSDVATSGAPRVLVRAPPTKFINLKETGADIRIGCGTATGPLLGLHGQMDFNLENMMLLGPFGVAAQDKQRHGAAVVSSNRFEEQVLNQETFLDLIDILDETRERKREALAILNDCPKKDMGEAHYDWLLGYLRETSAVAKRSLDIMRVFYGDLYRNSQASDKEHMGRKVAEKYLKVHSDTDIPESVMKEWSEIVYGRSKEIAALTASSVGNLSDCESVCASSLRERLTTCGQAIVLAKYASLTAPKRGSTESLAIIKKIADEMCDMPFPESKISGHIYSGCRDARKRSVADLKEALTVLECELRLSCFGSLQPTTNGGGESPINGS